MSVYFRHWFRPWEPQASVSWSSFRHSNSAVTQASKHPPEHQLAIGWKCNFRLTTPLTSQASVAHKTVCHRQADASFSTWRMGRVPRETVRRGGSSMDRVLTKPHVGCGYATGSHTLRECRSWREGGVGSFRATKCRNQMCGKVFFFCFFLCVANRGRRQPTLA